MLTRAEAAVTVVRYHKYIFEEKSILSIVLKGQLIIESEIEALIETVYTDPTVFNLSRMLYPQKLDLLIAIGVFSKEEIIPYKEFNKIRRKYAHDLNYLLKLEDLKKVTESLTKKHLIIIGEDKFDNVDDSLHLLHKILHGLIFLITLQNSKDPIFIKEPNEPMLLSEMEFYKSTAEKILIDEVLKGKGGE